MFRVLQFNMQFGMGWDAASPDSAPMDIEATIREIRRHNADIVLVVTSPSPADIWESGARIHSNDRLSA